jgi:hypothetical protein
MTTSLILAARADLAGTPFFDGLPEFADKEWMRVNLKLVIGSIKLH